MKTCNLLALAGVTVLLSACIPSVNPFYTGKDVVFDPRLLGEWKMEGTQESWRFEHGGDKNYKFTVTEQNGKQGEFEAHLFKLKGHSFLDLTPTKLELKDDQAEMVGLALIPGHLLIRVREIEPTLKPEFFDWDWLQAYLKQNPKALAHRVGSNKEAWVLTAAPRELQRFVLKHLKDGELFKTDPAATGMVRQPNAAPAAIGPPAK